jgi:hypothetical protein
LAPSSRSKLALFFCSVSLSHFKGKKRLWIISGDGDYGTVHLRKRLLNPLLYQDLCKVADAPEVFWFDNILDGIKHFASQTGVKADKLPTPEKAAEINKELTTLLPLVEQVEGHVYLDLMHTAVRSHQQWYGQQSYGRQPMIIQAEVPPQWFEVRQPIIKGPPPPAKKDDGSPG